MSKNTDQETFDVESDGELDTGSWLFDSLRHNLENNNIKYDSPFIYEESNHAEDENYNKTNNFVKDETPSRRSVSSEKILTKIYELREQAIDFFTKTEIDTDISDLMVHQIIELGECASLLGAEVEVFDPYNYVSGLKKPDQNSHLQQIINRTKACYNAGKIKNEKIKDDNTIEITFEGSHKNILFVVKGEIHSDFWTGQEAIDYVYSPNSGKMLVKKYDNGKWLNISDNYKISWELNETENIQDLIEDEEIDIH